MGLRRVRVMGKGGKERVVPVDGAFFTELAAYPREERPAGCRAVECFVVLRGPTAGQPLSEAGLRRVFRTHRVTSGAVRVRPHRLRHILSALFPAAIAAIGVTAGADGPARPRLHRDDLSAQFGHSQRVVDASMRRFIAAQESICPNWVQLSVLAVVSTLRRDALSDQFTAGGFWDPRSTGTSYSSARI